MGFINLVQESVSVTTGFVTFSCFNLTVLLITLLIKLLDIRDLRGPALAWLVAIAITPTIWILRNKKMKLKAQQILRIGSI